MSKSLSQIKVLVALSGGVDSAVAAALLVEAGYAVTGAYMVNYDGQTNQGESCWVPDYQDAARVAASLGIKLLKFDFTKEYKEAVLDHMFSEYEAGRTPNPDVLCNKYVKFGAWLSKARELGFSYLATGHYARVSHEGPARLLEAADKNKDQTYFLHQLTSEQLGSVLFPIGDYTKPDVRELAKKYNLPVADKAESMGICFIGEVPMKEFLQTRIKPQPGNIIFSDGTIIGQHEGLAFYTIGQRQGLSLSHKPDVEKSEHANSHTKPLYVVAKELATNSLVVGFESDPLLYRVLIPLEKVHFINRQPAAFPLQCQVRFRHREALQECIVTEDSQAIEVRCQNPERAATPGQYAVFYKSGECLGGGIIN